MQPNTTHTSHIQSLSSYSTGFSKRLHSRCTNTGVHTLTLCFSTISSVCTPSPGGCGIYSIHEVLLFITSAQQMFGVISVGNWQLACPFKHLAYLFPLISGTGICTSTHSKQFFQGYLIRLVFQFWPISPQLFAAQRHCLYSCLQHLLLLQKRRSFCFASIDLKKEDIADCCDRNQKKGHDCGKIP